LGTADPGGCRRLSQIARIIIMLPKMRHGLTSNWEAICDCDWFEYVPVIPRFQAVQQWVFQAIKHARFACDLIVMNFVSVF
jgi:hypothetical protein